MIAYTRCPGDGRHTSVADFHAGEAIQCNLAAAHWVYVRPLPGGPYWTDRDSIPALVTEVVEGDPPMPAAGWQIGDEVVVRTIVYAGPQWEYRIYRLTAGDPNGASFGPVGRIAYGQRMY